MVSTKIFLVLAAIQVFSIKAQNNCRGSSWVQYEESCYLFAIELATWGEAQAFCMSMNARLVEIQSKPESDFLENTLRKMFANDTTNTQKAEDSFWLGGNDMELEGIFKWVMSNDFLTYTDWSPGQPDDAGTREDCMELRGSFQYHWNDLPCETRQKFICEMSVGLPLSGAAVGR